MRSEALKVLVVLICAFALAPSGANAYVSPGMPEGKVTDFANILSEETEISLEAELDAFEASTTIQMAVVTVNSLEGDDIAVFANELGREWGIGQEASDNGVLLLVAPNERKVRIEVGYGLEGAIPDISAGRVIDEIITPAFKEGDFDGGVTEGILALELLSQGEAFSASGSSGTVSEDTFFIFFFILVAVFHAGMVLISILARSKSWWLGGVMGVVGGGVLGMLFGFFYIGIVAILALGISGALFDFLVSRSYKSYKETGVAPPWYYGGAKGFGSGSGSSGGFGGGSFGGGGSSGSW